MLRPYNDAHKQHSNPMKRIHDSLQIVFTRHRLVFWYDPTGEWASAFETFDDPSINKRTVRGTEFGTKIAIHRDKRDARYLLYFPAARPPDAENWLLDMLVQGHEYKADRASLAVQEAGLSYEFLPVVHAHIKFFDSARRVQALHGLLATGDTERALELKMIAAITGADPEIDHLLLRFLSTAPPGQLIDPVEEQLGAFNLIDPFWKEVARAFGYTSAAPSLRDFATTLFRWGNPLEARVLLASHAKVFLQHWKDSRDHSPSFRLWSSELETTLHVQDRLDGLDDPHKLGAWDTFEAFDKYALHWLCRAFDRAGNDAALLSLIQTRRGSYWFAEHADGYEAVAQAIALRQGIAAAELKIGGVESGLARYIERWHPVDTAYRKFCHHQRSYGQVALLQRMVDWAEKAYINNFLLPLADQWGDQVRGMAAWRSDKLPLQTAFFDKFVRPFVFQKKKVCVVISDALRYEAAAEFAMRVRAENRWTADLEAMLASLPSYTQLGMASLLPGDARSIQLPEGTVWLDGKPTAGLLARNKLLAAEPGIKATALQAGDFLEMGTKTEARALIRDHDVVYIFHNAIDKVGDDAATEAKTAAAVETAFDELLKILSKIHSANGYNMLITSDHGFLFQQSDVATADDLALPAAREWLFKNRRFALGEVIAADPSVKVFTARQLGLDGDWQAAFPLSLGRFPLQGSGKRYVHGGVSLQEVVLPVLRIHKARADDTEQVEVDVLRAPGRITTGQITLALYQDRPVADKTLARTLRIGIYALNDTLISEVRTITFDSADPEPRQRERSVGLTLARASDGHNNQDVEIRLHEALAGTNQFALYKSQRARLQKPFTTDFDD